MSGAAGLSAAKRRRAGSQPTAPSSSVQSRPSYQAPYQNGQNMVNRASVPNTVTPPAASKMALIFKDIDKRLKSVEDDENLKLLRGEVEDLKTLVGNLQSQFVMLSDQLDTSKKSVSNEEKEVTVEVTEKDIKEEVTKVFSDNKKSQPSKKKENTQNVAKSNEV